MSIPIVPRKARVVPRRPRAILRALFALPSLILAGLRHDDRHGASERARCAALRGDESLLVIDDDGDLGAQIARTLEPLGYIVIGTEDPADALTAICADPSLWDVVVIDLVVPGMKGLDLLAAIKRVRAECLVILCSGACSDMSEARAHAHGADGLFFKPVEPTAIAQCIRDLRGRCTPTG